MLYTCLRMTRVQTPDEPSLRRLVYRFYEQVRDEPTLGPVFDRHLRGKWPEHLEKMVDFWCTVLLGARRFRGNPRAVHARLANEVDPADFEIWLELFHRTAREVFTDDVADAIAARASMMASGLQQAMFGSSQRRRPHEMHR
jgi:hemoglobin